MSRQGINKVAVISLLLYEVYNYNIANGSGPNSSIQLYKQLKRSISQLTFHRYFTCILNFTGISRGNPIDENIRIDFHRYFTW